MSKSRSFRGKPKKKRAGGAPAGGGRNPQAMMAQFQKMQQDMEAAQQELEKEVLEVTAGGGAIKIMITGHQRIQAIEIEPDLIDPEDAEMLQDMLIAGVNAAIEQSQAMSAERMEGISGGSGLNDMLGGLGLG